MTDIEKRKIVTDLLRIAAKLNDGADGYGFRADGMYPNEKAHDQYMKGAKDENDRCVEWVERWQDEHLPVSALIAMMRSGYSPKKPK